MPAPLQRALRVGSQRPKPYNWGILRQHHRLDTRQGGDSRTPLPQPPPGRGQLPAATGLRESRARRLLRSQGSTDLVSLLIALCRAAKASVPARGPGHLSAQPSGLKGLQRAWPGRG